MQINMWLHLKSMQNLNSRILRVRLAEKKEEGKEQEHR